GWKRDDGERAEGKRHARSLSLADQQAAGNDIVCAGEQTRQHFVTTFIGNLGGVDFENRRGMTLRDRYEAAVPVVVEAVTRKQAVFVEDDAFLRLHTDAPIERARTGAMVVVD